MAAANHNLPPVAVDWKRLPALVLLVAGVYRDQDGRVRVPYRWPDGSLFREKIYTDRTTYWGPGDGIMLFGLDAVASLAERRGCSIIICEGESDALAIRGAICGWRGGRLDVLGVPGAGTWKDEWSEHLDGYARVYVAADGDGAGRAMLDRISETVVVGVRSLAMPPGEDSRSIIQSPDGVERFAGLLADADKLAAQTLAFQLAATPEEWVRYMLAMRGEGVWS
jgi:hypothetical protein